MPHEWEIGPGATASVTDDLRFIVETDGTAMGLFSVEELLKREILRLAEERDRLEAENRALRSSPGATIVSGAERIAKLEGYVGKCEALVVRYGDELTSLRAERDELAQRVAELEIENSNLRFAEARLTGLRLEVDKRDERIAHLETIIRGHETNTRLFRARIDALIAEVRNLRTDLAAAIKTGEELALKAHLAETLLKPIQKHHQEGESALDTLVRCLREREEARRAVNALEDCRREWLVWGTDAQKRLSRLDALLASEAAPDGLRATLSVLTPVYAESAWRWFREQLGEKHS